jgi:hypothetical protein
VPAGLDLERHTVAKSVRIRLGEHATMIPARHIFRRPLAPWGRRVTSALAQHQPRCISDLKRPNVLASVYDAQSRRTESTVMGEGKSGHITAGPQEAILFFDSE